MKPVELMRRLAAGWAGDSLLPILLGLCATLGFAPWGWYVLTLLAPAGLLGLWAGVSARRAAWRGFLFGVAHFAFGLYWVYISIYQYGGGPLWLAWLLVLVLASYLAIFPALIGYALRRWFDREKVVVALLVLPLLWMLAELLRGWLFTGLPWLSLGYSVMDTPLSRLAPVAGVYALSAAMVVVSGTFWLLMTGQVRERGFAMLALLMLSLLVAGLPTPLRWTQDSGDPVGVSLVQGSIPQELKWRPGRRQMTQAHYYALTEPEWGRRLIIWPEVAIPALRHQVQDYLDEMDALANASGSTLLVGVLVRDQPEGPLYNAMLSLGVDRGSYYKRHLLPFGEYFPAPKFLLDVGSILGLQYSDFSSGPQDQAPLRLGTEVLGLSICFEDVFGRDIRRDLPLAGLLVNVTNDAWFDDSAALHQHLQIARMRALEMGRTLLRVANTGVTAVIGPDGKIELSSPPFEANVLRAQVMPRRGQTPYVRWGDGPLWGLSLAGLLFLAVRRRTA